MERVQGRDIFHSGVIFVKPIRKAERVAKTNPKKCIKLANNLNDQDHLRKQIELRTEKDCSLHILHAGGNYTVHHSGYAYIILTCY